MKRIPWELVWTRDPGFRTEMAPSGVNIRLNWLLSRDKTGVRYAYGENDRPWDQKRRLVALDGLRLAVDLLEPGRPRLLYTARHISVDNSQDARSQAFALCRLSVADMRRSHPDANVGPGQLRQIEWSVPARARGEEMRLANDVYNTGVIVELDPSWGCTPDANGNCIETLDLQRALLAPSWERLCRKLYLATLG